MTGRQPNPRDVRRLATLEADLKAQREAADQLLKERNALAGRVTELESNLKAVDTARSNQTKADEALIKQLERLFKANGLVPPPSRELPAFIEALTGALSDARSRAERAEQQIETLEAQLSSAADTLKEATQKFRDLKADVDAREAEHKSQVAALSADLKAAKVELDDLRKAGNAIEPLLAENQRLATQIEESSTELVALRAAAASARSDVEAARSEVEQAVRAEVGKEVKQLTKAQATLQKQLDAANAQLTQEGKTPVLPAGQVAVLINELVGEFQSGLSGLQIRDGELALKVGFGAAGEIGGFVVPTTESTPEVRENLHEIKLRFDREAPAAG